MTGPAVFEERESTTIVPPGASARVDAALNLVIDTRIKELNDKLGDRPHIMISRPRVIS